MRVLPATVWAMCVCWCLVPLRMSPAAGVTVAGAINDDAGAEISEWKTATTTKSWDADGDDRYGTLAHLFYRIEFKGQGTLYTFDSSDAQVGPFPGYALVDHPDGVSADIQVRTTTNNAAGLADDVMFTFTALAGSPANVRIGIVTDGLDGTQFSPASIGLRQVGGSSAEHVLTSVNNTLDMVFFDVTGIAGGDQFQVFGDSGTGNFATHQIVTWDELNLVDIFDPTDTDNDMLGDNWERFYFTVLTARDGTLDFEPDGLTDLEEWQLRTNPKNPDTDGDTLTDGDEVDVHGTNPLARDTDMDGFDDNVELDNGSNPTNGGITPQIPATLWSVDIQAVNGTVGGQGIPVLMTAREPASGYISGVWNAFEVNGHDQTSLDPTKTLVNARGDVTPVSFTVFGNISGFTNASGNPLTSDYLFVNAGNSAPEANWEIANLLPGSVFEMFAYGGTARDVALTLDRNGDGSLLDETPVIVPGTGSRISNITVASAGRILGRVAPGTVPEGNWSGFQLRQTMTPTVVDTDNDGLSDAEEDNFGTDRFNPDTDGDGQTDGAEVKAAGTDPKNAASVLRIIGIAFTNREITLTWTSVPGKTYTIEANSDLTVATGWSAIATGIAASGAPAATTTALVETPGAGIDQRHYRVVVFGP